MLLSRSRLWKIGPCTFDRHNDVPRAADGARLVHRDPNPREVKLFQHQKSQTVCQCFDQFELRRFHESNHALCDLLVVERVFNFVANRGVAAVNGQLEIEHDRLFDQALPIDEADGEFDGQAVQENDIAGADGGGHSRDELLGSGGVFSPGAPRDLLEATERGRGWLTYRAGLRTGAQGRPLQSSPRYQCKIRCADSTRDRLSDPPSRSVE